jgi:hypothetical protein
LNPSLETERERLNLLSDLNAAFSRALEAHLRGIHPPSNYGATLLSLAQVDGARTDPDSAHWYSLLTYDIPHPGWNPEDPAFINWLFFLSSDLRRRHWKGWTTERLEALLALLKER